MRWTGKTLKDRRERGADGGDAGTPVHREDFGLADRSTDSGVGERSRSWADRAASFFGGRDEGDGGRRRRGLSDRVLWAVIAERLESERGLDLGDVEVLVDNAEVTLNGDVRRKTDKRRIEDIADLEGVRHVQNNLRVRDGGRRWF